MQRAKRSPHITTQEIVDQFIYGDALIRALRDLHAETAILSLVLIHVSRVSPCAANRANGSLQIGIPQDSSSGIGVFSPVSVSRMSPGSSIPCRGSSSSAAPFP